MAENEIKKKIKQIKIGNQEPLEVYDVEAVHTINGYASKAIEAQTVMFANLPISKAEIEEIFTTQASTEGGN